MAAPTTICRTCELRQRLPGEPGRRLRCARCGSRLAAAIDPQRRRRIVLAFAIAALILYPLAVGLPVMRIERLGHVHETGILGGGIDLLARGDLALGLLVLGCSVVLPLVKLLGLLTLACGTGLPPRFAGRMLRFVEGTGRWGMLDVLLVAILAALVKLGELVAIEPGLGATTFVLCVALSLVASSFFDPRIVFPPSGAGGAVLPVAIGAPLPIPGAGTALSPAEAADRQAGRKG
ncbi:MAG TPA: paraquat-inducible protein A [Phycisphaerales bacterium]|nr:paraquat-inducible protein A [Phycisphaerales bacterium]HMP38053.1 paraquat-inducible protein A [Phycisphaerales bacterium]